MRKLFRTKKRTSAVAVVAFLVLGGSALAAFMIFSGAEGSGSGTFAGTENAKAITIVDESNQELSPVGNDPGTDTTVVSLINNDPDNAHTLDSLSGTFTTSPAECAAHMTLDGTPDTSPAVGTTVPPGETVVAKVAITTDRTTPVSCAGGTWSLDMTGTTTP